MSRPLELILARQWSGLLSVPVLLFDTEGVLVYFNEPAEVLLGRKFEETGSMVSHEWMSAFAMDDADGNPIAGRDTPLAGCVRDGVPTQRSVMVRGFHGVRQRVIVTAFPIKGLQHQRLGTMALINSGV